MRELDIDRLHAVVDKINLRLQPKRGEGRTTAYRYLMVGAVLVDSPTVHVYICSTYVEAREQQRLVEHILAAEDVTVRSHPGRITSNHTQLRFMTISDMYKLRGIDVHFIYYDIFPYGMRAMDGNTYAVIAHLFALDYSENLL